MTDERLGQAALRADAATAPRFHLPRGVAVLWARLAHIERRAAIFLVFALARVPSFPDVRPGWAMSGTQIALNVLLAGLSLIFVIRIADTVFRRGPALPIRVATSAGSPASVSPVVAGTSRSAPSYDLIPARNLFHPDRAQPKRSDALAALPPASNLMLYGVVGSEDDALAYIEDPTTKKIFGYKRGDPMAGGYVERIEPDRIVIQRMGGPVEILLRAPNKPRPVAAGTPPPETAATVAPSQPASSSPGIPPGIVRRNRD